jgi:hypothetical protein
MGTTRYSAEGPVGRGLSPAIWQAYGFIGGNQNDPSMYGFFFDDFAMGTSLADGDAVSYAVHNDGGTIAGCPDVDLSEGEFGVLRLTPQAADNDSLAIQMGGNLGNLVKIDDTAGENGVVAFECRIKVATITTGDLRLFFGLAEAGCADDDAIFSDTAATFGDKDYIGFMIKEADGASLIRVFHKASGTQDAQDTGDDLVVDTWVKLGLVYDPNGPSNAKVKFFVDGDECTNFADVRCDSTDLADDTNFPSGEELAPCINLKGGATVAATDYVHVDWWAVGQGFTGGI